MGTAAACSNVTLAGLSDHCAFLGDAQVLGKGAACPAKYLIARLKLGDAPTHRCHRAREVGPKDRGLHQPGDIAHARQREQVNRVCRRRVHPYQHAIVGDDRPVDFGHVQHIW